MAVSKEKEIKKEEQKEISEGTVRRKRDKKSRKIKKWSGLVLFLILFLLGFLLWVGGEIKEGGKATSREKETGISSEVMNQGSGSVIIIE